MRRTLFPLLLLALAAACAPVDKGARGPEPLFFAVEVKQAGLRVGSTKLLGYSERAIVVERSAKGAARPDYHLELRPRAVDRGYQVAFSLDLGHGVRSSEVSLLHGEERQFSLGDSTEVTVRLLKVDSPEFRALMAPPPVLPVTSM